MIFHMLFFNPLKKRLWCITWLTFPFIIFIKLVELTFFVFFFFFFFSYRRQKNACTLITKYFMEQKILLSYIFSFQPFSCLSALFQIDLSAVFHFFFYYFIYSVCVEVLMKISMHLPLCIIYNKVKTLV